MRQFLIGCFLLSCCGLMGQTKAPEPAFDLHTFYICIDSATYRNLFTQPYLRDTLFLSRDARTKAHPDEYSGKFAIGRTATLEFFTPGMTDQHGDHFGDAGIGFKTRATGTLTAYAAKARQQQIPVNPDTSYIPAKNGFAKWYASLNSEHRPDPLSLIMLEYLPEYLRSLGFSAAEQKRSYAPLAFNDRLAKGKKFSRLFSHILSVQVVVSPAERQLLRDFTDLYGFILTEDKMSGAGADIFYTIRTDPPVFRVSRVDIALLKAVPEREFIISPNLRIQCKGKTASLYFSY